MRVCLKWTLQSVEKAVSQKHLMVSSHKKYFLFPVACKAVLKLVQLTRPVPSSLGRERNHQRRARIRMTRVMNSTSPSERLIQQLSNGFPINSLASKTSNRLANANQGLLLERLIKSRKRLRRRNSRKPLKRRRRLMLNCSFKMICLICRVSHKLSLKNWALAIGLDAMLCRQLLLGLFPLTEKGL